MRSRLVWLSRDPLNLYSLPTRRSSYLRHLRCRAQEKLARVGRHTACHLDQTEEPVDVRTLDRRRYQRAGPFEQHQGPLDAERKRTRLNSSQSLITTAIFS